MVCYNLSYSVIRCNKIEDEIVLKCVFINCIDIFIVCLV